MATIKYERVRPTFIGRTWEAKGRDIPGLFEEGVLQVGNGYDRIFWVEGVTETPDGIALRLVDRKGIPYPRTVGLDETVEVFQTVSLGDPFKGLF